MAQPIRLDLPPRDPRADLRTRLEAAPVAHAEALLSAYEVLQGLHDRGALEICRGLLGSSDKVLEIVVDVAKAPDSIRGLRNLLLVVNALGAIDPESLAALTQPIPQALQALAKPPSPPPGLFRLGWRLLWDRDIHRTLAAGSVLLKAVGQNLALQGRPNAAHASASRAESP